MTREEHLAAVKAASAESASWRIERDDRIRAASAAGIGLRDIAAAAGCSHQTVKNILDRG